MGPDVQRLSGLLLVAHDVRDGVAHTTGIDKGVFSGDAPGAPLGKRGLGQGRLDVAVDLRLDGVLGDLAGLVQSAHCGALVAI